MHIDNCLFFTPSTNKKYFLKENFHIDNSPFTTALESKPFSLPKGHYQISLDVHVKNGGIFCYVQRTSLLLRCAKIISSQAVQGEWETRIHLRFEIKRRMSIRVIVANYNTEIPFNTEFQLNGVSVSRILEPTVYEDIDTCLPGWSMAERVIHRMCKRYRLFNSLVASTEMRMGREVLLSLPQYMGLCPTGKCNASCIFCSVGSDRDGIIKKDLEYDRLNSFVAPISRIVRLFGLEGNGEPTLYPRFDELINALTIRGADFYLITNGAKLKDEQIGLLLSAGLSSINISLNAATSETHFKVMRLKQFGSIINNIDRLSHWREKNGAPDLSISFVVTAFNIHEVVDFIELGLKLLRNTNDRIYIRPLSELANDSGNVEDLREIVPFESDILDMIDGVNEYLAQITSPVGVVFQPETFKSFRPDPPDRIILPKGYERHILPPRKDGWQLRMDDAVIEWALSGFFIEGENLSQSQAIMETCMIPVAPDEVWRCLVEAEIDKGACDFVIIGKDGSELACCRLDDTRRCQWNEMLVETSDNDAVFLRIRSVDECLQGLFRFERFRRPANFIVKDFQIPAKHRWQIESPGAFAQWEGSRMSIRWDGVNSAYLVKSYLIRCLNDSPIALPVDVEVTSGVLGIGILSQDMRSWVHQFSFPKGQEKTALTFCSGCNHGLYIIIYSLQDGLLEAHINWKEDVLTIDDNENSPSSPPLIIESEVKKIAPDDPLRPEIEKKTHVPIAKRARRATVKYYCQKPWTDLNNYTVDGRMDVCCIATGPSQEHYALGNIYEDNFQDIWNGQKMREFRRTVNSKKKLPPCQRCPMAYAYQGLFFSPNYYRPLEGRYISSIFRFLGVVKLHSWLSPIVDEWIKFVFFKGFKR